MKFKKYGFITFMCISFAATILAPDDEGFEIINPDDENFEEINPDEHYHYSVLEHDIHQYRPLKPIKPDLSKSTIEISGDTDAKDTGLLGRAIKSLQRNSLGKRFVFHAKQINNEALELPATDQTFFKSLSTKEQQDIIDSWATNHKNTFQDTLNTLHKRYIDNVNHYKNDLQKKQMQEVKNNEQDIAKNNALIAKNKLKIEAIDKKLSKDSKNAGLILEKDRLQQDINLLESTVVARTTEITDTLKKIKRNLTILDANYKEAVDNLQLRYNGRNISFFDLIKNMLNNKTVIRANASGATHPHSQSVLPPSSPNSGIISEGDGSSLFRPTKEDVAKQQFEDFFANFMKHQEQPLEQHQEQPKASVIPPAKATLTVDDSIRTLENAIGEKQPTDLQRKLLKKYYITKYKAKLENDDEDNLIKNSLTRLYDRLDDDSKYERLSSIDQIKFEALKEILNLNDI